MQIRAEFIWANEMQRIITYYNKINIQHKLIRMTIDHQNISNRNFSMTLQLVDDLVCTINGKFCKSYTIDTYALYFRQFPYEDHYTIMFDKFTFSSRVGRPFSVEIYLAPPSGDNAHQGREKRCDDRLHTIAARSTVILIGQSHYETTQNNGHNSIRI